MTKATHVRFVSYPTLGTQSFYGNQINMQGLFKPTPTALLPFTNTIRLAG